MFPTAFVYSSHNRSELIHRWWLIERALKSIDNKTLLYIPMSMGEMHQQEYSWGTFRWYLSQYTKYGLEPRNFYWRDNLSQEDVALFFGELHDSEVVILGGGNSYLGMQRYEALGEKLCGNPHFFGEVIRKRQREGKLTAGFSAGADQLCSLMAGAIEEADDSQGFGLAHTICCTLHHEWGREDQIKEGAHKFPNFMVFGLPNDSGLAVDQGHLPSGNMWQEIEVVVDTTWDIPEDNWHIKTRSGMGVVHYYQDGRRWDFSNGDKIIRVIAPNSMEYDAWILPAKGGIYHYWSQAPSGFQSADHILSAH